eukprot:scaffold12345_cov21-Tisochrysis_lutea.AAC.1
MSKLCLSSWQMLALARAASSIVQRKLIFPPVTRMQHALDPNLASCILIYLPIQMPNPLRSFLPLGHPTPLDASNKEEVFVGRVRQDISQAGKRGLDLFVCGDQIKKGAALNAVQVAEQLVACIYAHAAQHGAAEERPRARTMAPQLFGVMCFC